MSNRVENTTSKVDDLTPEQRRLLLERLLREKAKRKGDQTAPAAAPVHALFFETARLSPSRLAIAGATGEVTYGQLSDRALQIAAQLRAQSLPQGSLIAILVTDHTELIASILGVLQAGHICLPLSADNPRDWNARLIRRSDPRLAILSDGQPVFEGVAVLDPGSPQASEVSSGPPEPLEDAAHSLAFVVAATEHPLAFEHAAVVARIRSLQERGELTSSDRVAVSLHADHESLVWQVLWPLTTGATLIPASTTDAEVAQVLDKNPTVILGTPQTLDRLVAQPVKADPVNGAAADSGIRVVLCSGGVLSSRLADEIRKRLCEDVRYSFGIAETGGPATMQVFAGEADSSAVSIGQPLAGSIYLLDPGMQLVPIGVVGEIYVGTEALARGYWHDDERTAQTFISNPFSGTAVTRLCRTRNPGRRTADGRIELVASATSPTWIDGYRVSPEEVAAVILEDDAIGECAVLQRGESTSDGALLAYVVPAAGAATVSPERLRHSLAEKLPRRLVPEAIVLISVMPLTMSGDVDESALSALEIIDDKLVSEWEQALQSRSGIDQAVVVAQTVVDRRRPLHLSDVLAPAGKQSSSDGLSAAASVLARADEGPLVDAWSDGGPLSIPADAPRTFTDALLNTAARWPAKGIVFVAEDGSESFQSYELLLDEAKRVLTGLRARGFKPGDRAILQIRSLRDHFSIFWGCVLGGVTPVTVAVASSYDSTNAVANKLLNVWELLKHPKVLASDTLRTPLEGLRTALHMSALEIVSVTELKSSEPAGEIHPARPEDVLFLQLSSGSTGIPKCIQITHRGVIAHIHGAQQFTGYETTDVSLNWLPMDHVVPILTCHLKDVYLGCSQVAIASSVVLGDATRWLDLIDKHRATHTWAPNFGFKIVSDALTRAPGRSWDLSSIKYFMNAGEQVTLPVVRDFLRLTGPFGVRENAMQPAFGMAEACTCMTYQINFAGPSGNFRVLKSTLSGRLQEAAPGETEAVDFIGLGGPVPGVQIRIADKSNQVVPECVIGRMQIKGDVITPGYLYNEEANRDAFVGDGWFNSGDLGFIRNGELTLTGREKEIIIVNGANFYCYEIEDVVNQVEGVEPTFSAACGLSDPMTGTEGLAVFFSPRVDDFEDNVELTKKIRATVTASLGISPASVVPIPRHSFPKTTSGKIQRTKLKKQLEEGYFDEVLKAIDIHLENARTIPDWFFEPVWKRCRVGLNTRDRGVGVDLIFVDHLGIGEKLAQKSERQGNSVVRIERGSSFERIGPLHFRINAGSTHDYAALFDTLQSEHLTVGRVVHLWTCDGFEDLKTEAGLDAGLYSLLRLTSAVSKVQGSSQTIDLRVISTSAQYVSSGDRVEPVKCALLGLLRTIPQEMPWIEASHIDLRDSDDSAASLALELNQKSNAPFVALRNGERWIQRLERVSFSNANRKQLVFARNGRYVITGGLGGVAIEMSRHLLETYGARIVLLGRTPIRHHAGNGESGSSARADALETLEKLGGEVIYEACDIADTAALRTVIERTAQRWDGIDGVIHCAGLFHERMIVDETPESMNEVLRPKVQGTLALAAVMEEHPAAFFVTFSSVNAFFGGVGVAAYAAANSFLSGFAMSQFPINPHRSYSLLWSMWDEVGMSRDYGRKELSRARGYYTIPASQGVQSSLIATQREGGLVLIGLDTSSPQIRSVVDAKVQAGFKLTGYFTSSDPHGVGVYTRELHELDIKDRFGRATSCDLIQLKSMPVNEAGEIDRARLESGDGRRMKKQRALPRTELESQLARIWQSVLNIPQIGVHDSFFELGGHSLLAVRLIFRVREVFNVEFPVDKVIESPTIASMARWLEQSSAELAETGAVSTTMPDCLVPLQTKGSRAPFFCVHPAGGSPLCYLNLSSALGEDRPFIGFQSPGLFGECAPLTKVTEIADTYVRAMRAVQPKGPYLIGAWSSGGPVAFEMARVLEREGQQAALVAMFDCGVMESDGGMREKRSVSPAQLVKGSLMLVRFGWQLGLPTSYRELRQLGQFAGISLPPRMRDAFRRKPGTTFGFLGTLREEISRAIEIFRINSLAGLEYEPQAYSGKVTLFRADEHRGRKSDPVIQDLRKFAADVDVTHVPGNHMSIILEKQGSTQLAKKLKECLDQY